MTRALRCFPEVFRARALRSCWALVAALTLVSPSAFATVAYECAMSGHVEASPCCPDHGRVKRGADGAVESRPCCAMIEQPGASLGERREASSATPGSGLVASALPPAATARAPLVTLNDAAPAAHVIDGPPPRGPPLYVRNCAYLI